MSWNTRQRTSFSVAKSWTASAIWSSLSFDAKWLFATSWHEGVEEWFGSEDEKKV
jgi:hypothetical protein